MSATLFIPPLDQWPAELLYEYHERSSIKHLDGGMALEVAEAQALVEVWEARQV